jgi:hypothetical protein
MEGKECTEFLGPRTWNYRVEEKGASNTFLMESFVDSSQVSTLVEFLDFCVFFKLKACFLWALFVYVMCTWVAPLALLIN